MATIFSKIIQGEIPSYKVAEDRDFYAFLDIHPITEGHTLVVPRKEVDYIFDLDERTLSDMILFAQKVARSIKEGLHCERVAIAVLGLQIPHAHIHLIPINNESDFDFKKKKLSLPPEKFLEIMGKIKIT